MAEIIRTWLRSRLGVIIDLTPTVFGHYCRDGTFLAKLLHSYDIISDSQLNTIIPTSDPALARVNLRHLRVWLKFIGITCDDKTIRDISNGKGTASLRLFYKVFLCLENKDRLHFITLEKEREKYIPTSTKFDVKVVSEDTSLDELPKHPLSSLLEDNENNLEWYKKKFQRITDDFRRERESFRESQKSKVSLQLSSSTKFDSALNKEIAKNRELEELDSFAKKHKVTSRQPKFTKSDQSKKDANDFHLQKDSDVTKEFMNILKRKKQQAIEIYNFKSQMQNMLLSQVWEKMENDQEKEFDKIIAQKVLRQSQYEKQMIRKLCDIRNEKRRLAANRQLVDELMQKTRENHINMIQESERQIELWENEEIDDECRRRNELHQRIKKEKLKILREKHCQITNSIINDIVNIAIIAVEVKHSNDGILPEYMWNDWKCLFVHNIPIIEPLENKSFNGIEECVEEIVANNPSKDNILSEKDFEDYHHLKPPWNEFIPELDQESEEFLYLGIIVLGYIIHKVFNSTLLHSSMSLKQKLPDVKVRAVVLGIPDPSFYPQIQGLLKHKKIKLVLAADAINYCLLKYKAEMKNYEHIELDIEVNKSRKNSQQSVVTNKSNSSSKQTTNNNNKKSKKTKTSSIDSEAHGKNVIDKQIQTPKNIPYDDMDPVLSNTAYIGKSIHEFFVTGKPISDELTAQSIFEYLKSLKDIRGWVLLNYPNTYEQMVCFERILSGNNLPDLWESIQSNDLSCEDDILKISTHSFRDTFQSQHRESIKSLRDSKLIPNPLNEINSLLATSHLTAFIRMLPKPKKVDVHPEELFEIRPEDSTILDEFYKDQGLASVVYYSHCDFSTIKRVARLIIGETSLPRKSSTELFGQVSKDVDHVEGRSQLNNEQSFKSASKEFKVENRKPKPGEPDWSWVDLPVPQKISKALTLMWQNLEDIYIDGLKDVFLQRRSTFLAIIPYKEFVRQKMVKLLSEPDGKQALLKNFQKAFNEIPEEARDDDEMKNELHYKVSQFQTELWNICNVKRREAQEERKSIILNHWTAVHVIDLINIYLTIIQFEMDRFIDTLKLIQTYYLSMLQRPLQDEKFLKIRLNKLTSDSDNSVKVEGNLSSQVSLEDENKMNLVEVSDNFRQLCCYKIIESTTEFVDSIIKNMLHFITISFQSKEKPSSSRRSSDRKGKRKSSKKISISSSSKEEINVINERFEDVFIEWKYAAMYEINRIQMRVKILEASVESDIDYLLRNMQHTFISVHEMINKKYEKEMKDIDNVVNIFCLAIEKEKSIKGTMTFSTDDLNISEYISIDSRSESASLSIKEQIDDLKFSPEQLGRLKGIFQHVAPSGLLAERSFIYILQDLIVCGNCDQTASLPLSWYKLTSQDVVEMVDKLFNNDGYIDWREFIISLIDIAMPDQDELLDAREAFQAKDPKFTELIFKQDFLLTPLWFLKSTDFPLIRSSLHNDFDVDEEEQLEEELGIKINKKMVKSIIKLEKYQRNSLSKVSSKEKINPEHEKLQKEEMMKLSLIKQLLSELFLVNYCTINYMAMLLAFCKHENPSYGLGNAISLTLGKKICLDFNQGEKYVNGLLEEKRLESNLKLLLRQEIFEFCHGLIEMVIDEIMDNYELTLVEILSTSNVDSDVRKKKQIVIGNLDSSRESSDPVNQLIEKSPLSDSNETNDKICNNLSDINKSSLIAITNNEKSISTREIVYWIPTKVFESVLLSMTTLNMNQNGEFHIATPLNEYFQSIYREIRCREIEEKLDIVLVHRLLHYPKIVQMLQLTNQFTCKNTVNVVADLLNKHEQITHD
ncbi:sperm flagellar protein 2-like [Chelonus insularis]|uniref:sperm flagellar protein 2-like n=1 Tax=Chelonus insularis TaxID=460826 RepID=UPI00158B6DC3|nr:sperm flagellar protein 2-like [Chelonus insularis]